MAICYKKYKLERTFSDGRQDPANGKWFARAVSFGTVGIDQLAENISYSTTATKADVKAVIEAFIKHINANLMESKAVKIDGLGIFKASIHSTGAVEASEFSVSKNVKGIKVLFMPTRTVAPNGKVTRHLCDAPKFMEARKNQGKNNL